MLESVLSNFNIWIHYNRYGKTRLENINETVDEFLKATSGKHKYCKCKPDKGKVINDI